MAFWFSASFGEVAVKCPLLVPVKGGVNLDHFGGAKVDQLVKG